MIERGVSAWGGCVLCVLVSDRYACHFFFLKPLVLMCRSFLEAGGGGCFRCCCVMADLWPIGWCIKSSI